MTDAPHIEDEILLAALLADEEFRDTWVKMFPPELAKRFGTTEDVARGIFDALLLEDPDPSDRGEDVGLIDWLRGLAIGSALIDAWRSEA